MKLEKINSTNHVGVNLYFISIDRPNNILGYDLMTSNQGFISKYYWFNSDKIGFVEDYSVRFMI